MAPILVSLLESTSVQFLQLSVLCVLNYLWDLILTQLM
uniref:Uncharacterized protein n=1 Tax=Anguilla anguilla TaxID=7936 RepID=A0A0E9T0K4_ANGAN